MGNEFRLYSHNLQIVEFITLFNVDKRIVPLNVVTKCGYFAIWFANPSIITLTQFNITISPVIVTVILSSPIYSQLYYCAEVNGAPQ